MNEAKMLEAFYNLTAKLSSSNSGEYRAFKIAWQAAYASRQDSLERKYLTANEDNRIIRENNRKLISAVEIVTKTVEELKAHNAMLTDAIKSLQTHCPRNSPNAYEPMKQIQFIVTEALSANQADTEKFLNEVRAKALEDAAEKLFGGLPRNIELHLNDIQDVIIEKANEIRGMK